VLLSPVSPGGLSEHSRTIRRLTLRIQRQGAD
jgi:hypothetical protein